MNPVVSHFPDLSALQQSQFSRLGTLYREWNEKINVISRKDIDNLYLHHVLHSLAIARFVGFKPGTTILDAGTGGGFPGIPLAIFFPEVKFTLMDSIAKKIKVVEAVASEIGLKNVDARWGRVESLPEKFDFVVSRAVTTLPEFAGWTSGLIKKKGFNDIPNGIVYLKGGDVAAETAPFAGRVRIQEIAVWFEEEFFETKKIIYLPVE